MDIPRAVEAALRAAPVTAADSLDAVLAADAEGRRVATEVIEGVLAFSA
jgi:hypothetical protein